MCGNLRVLSEFSRGWREASLLCQLGLCFQLVSCEGWRLLVSQGESNTGWRGDGNVRSDKVSGKASEQTSLFSGLLGVELVWWW